MTKIITFNNASLDCYAKSIQDFIEYLRNDINSQSQNCKNNKNYNEEQLKNISEIEENTKNDDFIINYFNRNWDARIIDQRKNILKNIIINDPLLKHFESYIIDKWVTNFYYNYDFLVKDDFVSEREKLVLNNWNRKSYFDEVLLWKNGNISIYLEYKKNLIFLCILSEKNQKDFIQNEEFIYQSLQNLAKLIWLEHISKSDVVNKMHWKKENEMVHFIKIESIWWNLQGKQYEERISQNFFTYLNEEINKRVVWNELFKSYLKTFSLD